VLEFYLTSCSSTYVADIKDIYFVLKQEPSFFVYTQLSSIFIIFYNPTKTFSTYISGSQKVVILTKQRL
jgi:hypothetical protein